MLKFIKIDIAFELQLDFHQFSTAIPLGQSKAILYENTYLFRNRGGFNPGLLN